MFTFRAQSGPRLEAEGRHSVAFWPARCVRSCLQGLAAGYAIRDAGARASRLANLQMEEVVGSDGQ
jgi:hypothetical protein